MTRSLPTFALLLTTLAGCDIFTAPGTDETDDTGTPPGSTVYDELTFSEDSTTSDGGGLYVVNVKVPAGATSFQVTSSSSEYPTLEAVFDPSGKKVLDWEDLIQSPRSVTNAIFATRGDVAFNWPIQEADGPIEAGTYEVHWAMLDANYRYAPNVNVNTTTIVKTDPSLQAGEAHVRIVWAEGIDQMPAIKTAVEQAVEHWREVWAGAGVTLVERYETSTLSPNLDFTWTGSQTVKQLSQTKEPGELQLVVGETVMGDEYVYGVSAGIPGTLAATKNTFVVLAWTTHAGVDGQFSDNDIMVMGETMAHETGHYMGLFHPVEGTWNQWDALDDTEECDGPLRCERDLGENLMYPYSLCGRTECSSQYVLTDDQGGVFQRAVGAE